MLYRVEAQTTGDHFAAAMSQMRTWLDQHRFEPDSFRESRAGPVTTFLVTFRSETQATAFAEAFSGRLLGTQPMTTAR
jgi:hypothetical protein